MDNLLRFLFNQEDSFYLLFLVFELLETLTILFSIFYFFLKHYLDAENREFFSILTNFSKKLTLSRKIVFFIFIFTFAIPNKVIINNKMGFITQTITNFGTMVLCSISPLFVICFAIKIKFILESYIFGHVCTHSPAIRAFVVSHFFNNDQEVAEIVFSFFWGQ